MAKKQTVARPTKKKTVKTKPLPKLTNDGDRTDLLNHRITYKGDGSIVNITRREGMYVLHLSTGQSLEVRNLVHIPSYRIEVAGRAFDDERTIARKRILDKILDEERMAIK